MEEIKRVEGWSKKAVPESAEWLQGRMEAAAGLMREYPGVVTGIHLMVISAKARAEIPRWLEAARLTPQDRLDAGDAGFSRSEVRSQGAMDSEPKRLSLKEAKGRLTRDLKRLNAESPQMSAFLRTSADRLEEEGLNVFEADVLPLLQQKVERMAETVKSISTLPAVTGFVEKEFKEPLDRFLKDLAKDFQADKILIWFGGSGGYDFTYTLGFSQSELASYYLNLEKIEEMEENDLDSHMGLVSMISMTPTWDLVRSDRKLSIKISLGRTKATAEKIGRFSLEDQNKLQQVLDQHITNDTAIWPPMFGRLTELGYEDFDQWMMILRHNSVIAPWKVVYLPRFSYMPDWINRIRAGEGGVKELAGFFRRMAKKIEDLMPRNAVFIQVLESGTNFYPTNITPIVQNVIERFTAEAREKGLSIEFILPKEDQIADAVDPNLLKLVLDNLIQNAIKYTDQGKITVRLYSGTYKSSYSGEEEKKTVAIEVSDTGIGIPEEEKTKILGRGVRGSNVGSRPGTGIGLDFVRWAVMAMRGELQIQSEVGKGSVFSVFFTPSEGEAGSSRSEVRSGDEKQDVTKNNEEEKLYFFGGTAADGNAAMNETLGGKGANLAEMTSLGIPIPPGFTIPNPMVQKYDFESGKLPEGVNTLIIKGIDEIERRAALSFGQVKKFGDPNNPLFLSVRSGAKESAPGKYKTITKIGLHRETLDAYAREIGGDVRKAYLDYVLDFMQGYALHVMGDEELSYEIYKVAYKAPALKKYWARKYGQLSDIVSIEELKGIVDEAEGLFLKRAGRPFPGPREQLIEATNAVLRSSHGVEGAACNIQAYVFGNTSDGKSGSGVIFTRNPLNGEKGVYGSFQLGVEGSDIVGSFGSSWRSRDDITKWGWEAPKGLETLRETLPEVYGLLEGYALLLETHFREIQDVEFAVQNGRLFLLQTRGNQKFTTPMARVKILLDYVHEGLISEAEALSRLRAEYEGSGRDEKYRSLLWLKSYLESPVLAENHGMKPVAEGVIVFPGVVSAPVFTNGTEQFGPKGILAVEEVMEYEKLRTISPDALRDRALGAFSGRGDFADHIVLRLRGSGETIPYLTNIPFEISKDGKHLIFQETGFKLETGTNIIIDGNNGKVYPGQLSPGMLEDSVVTKVHKGLLSKNEKEYTYYETLLKWILSLEIYEMMKKLERQDYQVVRKSIPLITEEEILAIVNDSRTFDALVDRIKGKDGQIEKVLEMLEQATKTVKHRYEGKGSVRDDLLLAIEAQVTATQKTGGGSARSETRSEDVFLFREWNELCEQSGAYGQFPEIFQEILKKYAEEGRYYHTIAHIESMLRELKKTSPAVKDVLSLKMAIWLHDVIYDPKRPDNEERSAEFAAELCEKLSLPAPFIARVKELILLTKTHRASPEDEDALILLDLDLLAFAGVRERAVEFLLTSSDFAVLSTSPEAFGRYDRGIRKEYSFVETLLYIEKRIEILEGFLKREPLFNLPMFRDLYEDAARKNLRTAIGLLKDERDILGEVIMPEGKARLSASDYFDRKVAVYPGHFEDFGKAQLDILKKAQNGYEKVVILVLPSQPGEDVAARVEMIQRQIQDFTDVAVFGIKTGDTSHISKFARVVNSEVLVRRLRHVPPDKTQLEAESALAMENHARYGLETIFIVPSNRYLELASELLEPYARQFTEMLKKYFSQEEIAANFMDCIHQYNDKRAQAQNTLPLNSRTALYAGSFDPVTNGHMEVIERASKLFDKVYVAVSINPKKKYEFDQAKRIQMIRESVRLAGLVNVEVMENAGLTVDAAASVGAGTLIRGARSVKDLSDELPLAWANDLLNPGISTFLIVPYKYLDVSSSMVKKSLEAESPIHDLVPGPVYWEYMRPRIMAQKGDAKLIGLVGGMGAGKSKVLEILGQKEQVFTIDLDEVNRGLLAKPEVIREITRVFGEEILDGTGAINKIKLRKEIFDNARKMSLLTRITYPLIYQEVSVALLRALGEGRKILVVEGVGLFEVGINKILDTVWFVDTPEKIRTARIMKDPGQRAPQTAQTIRQVMRRQRQLLETAKAHADVILDNSLELPVLTKKVQAAVDTLALSSSATGSRSEMRSQDVMDLEPQRLSLKEATEKLIRDLKKLNAESPQMSAVLRTSADRLEEEGLDVFETDVLPLLQQKVGRMAEIVKSISTLPTVTGFVENELKEPLDRFLKDLAKAFQADKVLIRFGHNMKYDLSYTLGFSQSELASYYWNKNEIEKMNENDLDSHVGLVSMIHAVPTYDLQSEDENLFIKIALGRTKATAEKIGKFSPEDRNKLQQVLDQHITNGTAIWLPMFGRLTELGYEDFDRWMMILRHNSGVDHWKLTYLPWFSYVPAWINRIRSGEVEVKKMADSLRRMAEEVGNDISKNDIFIQILESGVNFHPTNITPIVQNMVEQFTAEAREKGLSIEFIIPKEDQIADAIDPNLLRLVLDNLIQNAIKYTDQGRITVRLYSGTYIPADGGEEEKKTVAIEVSDTGIGIPKEEKTRILDRGVRGSNVGSRPGTGIGLDFVHYAAHSMKGELHIQSEVGKGSVFSVFLTPAENVRSEVRKKNDGTGASEKESKAWVVRDATGAEKGLAYQTPLLLKGPIDLDQAWRDFHSMVFEFPKLLERAAREKLPVVLVVPEKLEGFGPLADEAPWIEGARTALAWASAYFRFEELGNVDVRVLQISGEEVPPEQVGAGVQEILSRNIRDVEGSPEAQMEARIFRLKDVLKTTRALGSDLLLEWRPIAEVSGPEKSKAVPEIIRPDLPPVPNGKKRIVVTGAAGFIGINLVKRLLAEGHQVIALDNLIGANEKFSPLFQHEPDLYFRAWDVSEPFEIEGPVDQVLHLASLASPPDYYGLPLETLRAGLQATRETMELARRKHAQFLFTSTSEVYGDAAVHPQPETYAGNVSPFKKRSQYDQSKRGAETLMQLYASRYAGEGLDLRIVRIFNTYGPFMRIHDGRVITNFIEKVFQGEPIEIYGDDKITRSFGYVEDTVDGLLKLLRTDKLGPATPIRERVVNIGNDSEFTLGVLAGLVNELGQKYLRRTVPVRTVEMKDPSDPVRRRPDLARARALLGYAPTISLWEGLEKTFLYFLNARSEMRGEPSVLETPAAAALLSSAGSHPGPARSEARLGSGEVRSEMRTEKGLVPGATAYKEKVAALGFELDPEGPGSIRYPAGYQPLQLLYDLILVPHGQTPSNDHLLFQGNHTDGGFNQLLTPEGKEAAKRGAEDFWKTYGEPMLADPGKFVFLVTPLERTHQTAGIYFDILKEKWKEKRPGSEFPFRIGPIDNDTIEIDFGRKWHDKTPEQVSEGERDAARAYREENLFAGPSDGENRILLMERALAWLSRNNPRYVGKTVVLFGHGTFQNAVEVLLRTYPEKSLADIFSRKPGASHMRRGFPHLVCSTGAGLAAAKGTLPDPEAFRSEVRKSEILVYQDAEGKKRLDWDTIPEGATKSFLAKIREPQYRGKIFLEGGAVRDLLMGQDPRDFDVLRTEPIPWEEITDARHQFEGKKIHDIGDLREFPWGKPMLSINRLMLGFTSGNGDPLLEDPSGFGYQDVVYKVARIVGEGIDPGFGADAPNDVLVVLLLASRIVNDLIRFKLVPTVQTQKIFEEGKRKFETLEQTLAESQSGMDIEIREALKDYDQYLRKLNASEVRGPAGLLQGVEVLRGGKKGANFSDEKEALALMDERGRTTGQSLPKKEVHQKGVWHMTAHIYLFDARGRLFLQKRSNKKSTSPGKLQVSVSGHVNFGEQPVEAAVRETEEEAGIRPDLSRFLQISKTNGIQCSYAMDGGQNNEFTTVFAYVLTDGEIEDLRNSYNTEESDEFWTMSLQDFGEKIWEYPEAFSRSLHYLVTEGRGILRKIHRTILRSEIREASAEPPGDLSLAVAPDTKAAFDLAAEHFLRAAREPGKNGKPNLMGVGTGATLGGVLNAIVEKFKKDPSIDLSPIAILAQDEYVGLSGDHPQSYCYFVYHNLVKPLQEIDPRRAIRMENFYAYNGTAEDPQAEIERIQKIVRDHGGIRLQLIGGGPTHYAFLEKAKPLRAGTLDRQLAYFNDFVMEQSSDRELAATILQMAAHRRTVRQQLSQDEALFRKALAGRRAYLKNAGLPEKPGLEEELVRELDALGKRSLAEQSLTFFIPELAPEQSARIRQWIAGGPDASRILLKPSSTYWSEFAKVAGLTLGNTVPDNGIYFSNYEEFPLRAFTHVGAVLEAQEIVQVSFKPTMAEAVRDMFTQPVEVGSHPMAAFRAHPRTVSIVTPEAARLIPEAIRAKAESNYSRFIEKDQRTAGTRSEMRSNLVDSSTSQPAADEGRRAEMRELSGGTGGRDPASRRALIQKIYPQLSAEAKRILLRPDVLAVFLGVKSAYIRYGNEKEEDPHPLPLAEAIGKIPEAWQHLGLFFTDNYIVCLDALRERLKKEGRFLVERRIISEKQRERFSAEEIDEPVIRELATILERYASDVPGRHILHGFLMGYALEDIDHVEQMGRAGRSGAAPDFRKFISYYGLPYLSLDQARAQRLLSGWDAALHLMYAALSRNPDFASVMPKRSFEAFRQSFRSEMRTDKIVKAIRKSVQPATVFVDALDFPNLSVAQKHEYFYAALSGQGIRIVVYNERGQVRDKELGALLQLDRVTRTDRDLAGAQISFDRPGTPGIHLSKQILPSQELVRRLGKRISFFKTQGQKGGTLAAALLWAWSGGEDARLREISLGRDGFWIVAESLVSALQRSYDATLAFAVAA